MRFLAVLDAVLRAQVLVVEEWHAQRSGAGEHELGQDQSTELTSLSAAIDSCSEILKATASLLSLNT